MRQRDIFWFWLPLFASWLLMTSEGPIISAAINRLPDEVVMLAAMGIVVSLSVTIESPIINLLATSTALAKDRASYLLLRRFTVHWMILLTAVTILLAFTPLFELVVVDWMGVPAVVAAWVQPGLRIMTFWSAAIAWRRFLQGIMIRLDHTRKVAWGTLVRLASSGGTVILLALWSAWPGVIIGCVALMAGVIAEAVYATVAVQPMLRRDFAPKVLSEAGKTLTYRELFRFHLPLAFTSVLILLVQPLVAFSLARLSNPTLSLAAWPVFFQFTLVARAAAFALPEVVIALSRGEFTFRPLRRFAFSLAAANTLVVIAFVMTPLKEFYLYVVQDLTSVVGALVGEGLILFIPLPALAILISWLRGLLINKGATGSVNAGMIVNVVVTTLLLMIGILQQWPGINAAALAITAAALLEFLYLWWRTGSILEFHLTLFEARKRALTG